MRNLFAFDRNRIVNLDRLKAIEEPDVFTLEDIFSFGNLVYAQYDVNYRRLGDNGGHTSNIINSCKYILAGDQAN
ncbi:hypothetical protein IWW39_006545, partial [Coemansia spiralis]